jgi:hypothetical protein
MHKGILIGYHQPTIMYSISNIRDDAHGPNNRRGAFSVGAKK